LEGRPAGWRDAFLYEYNYEKEFPFTPNVRAIRTEGWKFIRYPTGGPAPYRYAAELYDLQKDPLEMRNLAGDPAHKARRMDLERRLAELAAAAGPDNIPLDEGISDIAPRF
jgi:N-acetylglucosamine-6-sulfatase